MASGRNKQENISSNIVTVKQFDMHFADTATNPEYNRQDIESMIVHTPFKFDTVAYDSLEPFEV